jgi:hypothetical protein
MEAKKPHPNPSPKERELEDGCKDYVLPKTNTDCIIDE